MNETALASATPTMTWVNAHPPKGEADNFKVFKGGARSRVNPSSLPTGVLSAPLHLPTHGIQQQRLD